MLLKIFNFKVNLTSFLKKKKKRKIQNIMLLIPKFLMPVYILDLLLSLHCHT